MTKKQVDVKTHERQGKKIVGHKRSIEKKLLLKDDPQKDQSRLVNATQQLIKTSASHMDPSLLSDEELCNRYKEVYEQPHDAATGSTDVSWKTDWVTDKRKGESNEEHKLRVEEQTAIEKESVKRYKEKYLEGIELSAQETRALQKESQDIWNLTKDDFHLPLINGWLWEIKKLKKEEEVRKSEENKHKFSELQEKMKKKYGTDLLHETQIDVKHENLSSEELDELYEYINLSHRTGYQQQRAAETSSIFRFVQAGIHLRSIRNSKRRNRIRKP